MIPTHLHNVTHQMVTDLAVGKVIKGIIIRNGKFLQEQDQASLRKSVSHGKYMKNKFEKGFQETLLHKERTGDTNAPQRYMTSEGYPLGHLAK